MTRNGKVARLPRAIRDELNRRLQDGEPGNHLVHWLNQSEKVRKILDREFAGRPISQQNLSEWKAGGYLDWLRHEESRQLVTDLAEQQAELSDAAHDMEISDHYAGPPAVASGRRRVPASRVITTPPARSPEPRPSQTQSNPVKPNQTESNQKFWLRHVPPIKPLQPCHRRL